MKLYPNPLDMRIFISLFFLLVFTIAQASTLTNKIVVDQFGYRPNAKKVAVLRDPITGADAADSYAPGANFQVIKVSDGAVVFTGTPQIWNGGAEDVSSGDRAWWFDFSSVTAEGSYYILDVSNDLRSYEFEIRADIYNEVLKHAMRVFFYQRSGHEKLASFAGANWADGASHLGNLQDLNCRKWDDPNNAATEKDVHGGWYDAGDLNKYTTWTSNYVVELLRAYRENPAVWTDDYNIPESGNGKPDILDEVKWGLDHLLRLQYPDGSCISIVDADHGTPPSSASGPSLYGEVNTTSTYAASGAFALGAIVFKGAGETSYAITLEAAAKKAYDWAVANPNVLWKNNDVASGTKGIGAGQQEVSNDYQRLKYELRSASFLYELTGTASYDNHVISKYQDINMMQWNFAFPFQSEEQDVLLHHATLTANTTAAADILNTFEIAMDKTDNFQAVEQAIDPYRAHLKDYTWGSNNQKCSVGLMFWEVDRYLSSSKATLAMEAAEDYIHYIHGVNPMNLVYLTNMGLYGAENSANQMFHDWFKDGTDWDEAGVSAYGPAPGFVTGGPNPSYKVDACCPSSCGSAANNAKCSAVDLSDLLNQPKQKSYKQFNQSWPLNSWEITEPSMGYQVEYIRLLSKFVHDNSVVTGKEEQVLKTGSMRVYPNPAVDQIKVTGAQGKVRLFDAEGQLLNVFEGADFFSMEQYASGLYFIESNGSTAKVVKH